MSLASLSPHMTPHKTPPTTPPPLHESTTPPLSNLIELFFDEHSRLPLTFEIMVPLIRERDIDTHDDVIFKHGARL